MKRISVLVGVVAIGPFMVSMSDGVRACTIAGCGTTTPPGPCSFCS